MYSMLKIDWSEKRQRHALDRMLLRGISRKEFHEAILMGQKRKQRGNIHESIYRYFSVVYEEFETKKFRKIYPITVKVIA